MLHMRWRIDGSCSSYGSSDCSPFGSSDSGSTICCPNVQPDAKRGTVGGTVDGQPNAGTLPEPRDCSANNGAEYCTIDGCRVVSAKRGTVGGTIDGQPNANAYPEPHDCSAGSIPCTERGANIGTDGGADGAPNR